VLKAEGRIQVDGKWIGLPEVSKPRLGQKAAFVMDTRLCDAAFELAEGVDLLVCESTYLHADSELANKYGHMTATDAATIAKEAGADQLVLTHFSRRYPSASAFVVEARRIHGNVVAAEDGLRIKIMSRMR
jgi:ribonuclease Z